MPATTDQTSTDTHTDTDTGIYQRADVYHDFYHARGKDYRAEADAVRALIAGHAPGATSLLDVACGTGSHLRELAASFGEVVGVDLSAEMLAVAARHAPGVELHRGDMRDFRLDRTFDAVICMFSSIGYVCGRTELDRAVTNLAAHVAPDGVLIIEPWWFPDTFRDGWVGADVVTAGERRISRVSHTVRRGGTSRMDVHYVVAASGAGIEHFTDTHVMSLFDRADYERAFHAAGFRADYLRPDAAGPGLFAGVRR
ncbi:class I SAM-dependent DNA methyltransferase [Actinoplanes missouriensis]|nr:class I SAM-dependent methyltransferase [Actinoplanes missouriensis]